MNDDIKQIKAVIHGRVQGVMYRGTTANEAKKLKLAGWVRNNPDGTVSTVAEGNKQSLEAFVEYLHMGPPAARVTAVDVEWREATGRFKRFNVQF